MAGTGNRRRFQPFTVINGGIAPHFVSFGAGLSEHDGGEIGGIGGLMVGLDIVGDGDGIDGWISKSEINKAGKSATTIQNRR